MKTRALMVRFPILFLLFICSCSLKEKAYSMPKEKKGGIYQGSDSGVYYHFLDVADSAKLDTLSYIPFTEFAQIVPEGTEIIFTMTEAGKQHLALLTEKNIDRQVYIVVGDKIVMAPKVMGAVPGGKLALTMSDDNIKFIEEKLLSK